MKESYEESWFGWHFLKNDGTTGQGKCKPVPGKLMHCKGELVLCENGLHASQRAIDALKYAPGPIVQRVELSGTRIDSEDKACARSRRCLWIADASTTLHEFTCWCSEGALTAEREAVREPDPRSWAAPEAKRAWLRGEITTDGQLDAARNAARDARNATWNAARSTAAWNAARSTAARDVKSPDWNAAWDAAWNVAWRDARSAQNDELERRLLALEPKEEARMG